MILHDGDPGALSRVNDSGPYNVFAPSRGVSWANYDNDGDLDLYVTRHNSANGLFRNDGGSFVDVTPAPLESRMAAERCYRLVNRAQLMQ